MEAEHSDSKENPSHAHEHEAAEHHDHKIQHHAHEGEHHSHETVHEHASSLHEKGLAHAHEHRASANGFSKFIQPIWDNRLVLLLLTATFLLAFGIRGHLLRYHYLFEFDAFYHARLVEQLIQVGHIITPDPNVYYQVAGGVAAQPWSLFHTVSQYFYYLVSIGQPFSRDLLMWSMQFSPVLFGSIICIAMYFLGKEVFNSKKIGLITAFVAAVTPAFAYRTMAGAQGDNSFGFLWMVIGFIFFVRSVKRNELSRETLINAIISGIFFGLMAMTWRMYLLIPLIVIAYAIFAIILIASKEKAYNGEEKPINSHAFAFAVKVIISMAIFHVISYAYGEDWIADALGYIGSAIHLSSNLIALLTVIASIAAILISIFYISKSSKETKSIFSALAIIALYVGFIVMIFTFLAVPDLENRTTISSMVGEESVGNHFFGSKYNDLVIFPWIALVLLPIGLFIFRKEDDSHTKLIFFFWVILTLFMAWYKLKFTFVLGLAIAAAAAIVAYMAFEGLRKFELSKGIEAKIIFFALFFFIILGVGASARFFPDYSPFVDSNPQWQEAISWINSNTASDAKFFNWWDEGHILSFLTDRNYSTDNRNQSDAANAALAKFVITPDTNEAYTIASKEIGADYVILDSSMFSDAPTFEYYVANKVDPTLIQKYLTGTTRVIGCSGIDGNGTVDCQGNSISREQWNTIADKWKSTPDDFQNGSEPVFYYRTNNELLIMNQVMNNTNLLKVWMNSDETNKYYTVAYNKDGIKILKIKK